MTQPDTQETEFNFGDIDVGDSLEIDELEELNQLQYKESEEESEEKSEDTPEETLEETTDEVTEEPEEKTEETEELSTEEVLGDPLAEPEEGKESDGRSYEGFDDEDKQFAKQMSNTAYEHFSKKLQDLKKKKDSAEETQDLMSHPEAYTLNPEYQDLFKALLHDESHQKDKREKLTKIWVRYQSQD